jgi:uncharacterized protein (DUF302 family)
MFTRHIGFTVSSLAAAAALVLHLGSAQAGSMAPAVGDGVVKVRSAYPIAETISRIEDDIHAKGIMFFSKTDQGKLAADAGVTIHPSVLLEFGNPALGTLFISSNPSAGLDWPVRLLLVEDAQGAVWAEYTDFAWIARRHHIKDRSAAFAMASKVVASITAAVATKKP